MNRFAHSVLIVDDDLLNITALTHLLSDEFNVYTERSGRNSIAKAKECKPDVILLDIVMPDMNGFEIIAELKKDEFTKDIPVIFVTGLNNTRDEEQGLILGAVDYINKPFSSYILKLRIKNQLHISSQAQTIRQLSTTDFLTGTGLRNSFHEILDTEWRRALKLSKPISLAILCIDNFALYNDRYGHQKGDEALKHLSNIIIKLVPRAAEHLVRWGSDEFAVVYSGIDSEAANLITSGICEATEKDTLALDSAFLSGITLSAGLHSYKPTEGDSYTADNFVLDTVAALNYAKTTGGNKVSAFAELKGMD